MSDPFASPPSHGHDNHAPQAHGSPQQPIIPEMVTPNPHGHASVHPPVSHELHHDTHPIPPSPYAHTPQTHTHEATALHNEDFLASVLGNNEHHDTSEKSGIKKIVYKIIGFEEKHPWMFFGITAVIVFLIVIGIISVFVNRGNDNTEPSEITQNENLPSENVENTSNETSENTSTTENETLSKASLPPTMADSLENSIAIHPSLTTSEIYDTLVFQNYNNIYLAGYFENAQTLEKLLQIDIRQKLAETDQKEAVFDAYFQLLSSTHEEAVENYAFLETLRQNLKNEEGTALDELKEDKKNLQIAFSSGGRNELLEKVAVANSSAIKVVQIQTKYDSADILYGAYKRRLPVSEARLKDLEVNRKVIIENIQIIPIENSGIEYEVNTGDLERFEINESDIQKIQTQSQENVSNNGNISSSGNSNLQGVTPPTIRSNSFFMDKAYNPLESEAIQKFFGTFLK